MAVNDSVTQNLLPVQAYFNLDGTFNTFIGQNMPFYATVNPIQSGLTITNSTIDSTTIGANSPSTGIFTNISATTGQISTTPSNAADIANKFYVDTVAEGLGPKAACQVATTANITLSGLQTIDGYTTLAGDRVLVKNQTSSQFNGIYIAASGAWTRSSDMNVWSEVPGAYTVILNGGQLDTGWVCTATQTGTINVTAMPWVQFSGANTYFAGTGLTLSSNTFSITNTGVSASTYGSASAVPVIAVNAQGQITSATTTSIAIANTQVSGLGTMSTQNANSVAITGGSIDGTTIGGSSASAITGTTITATSSFSGSGSGLTGTATGLSIGGNAATATYATTAGSASSATTATTATNLAGGSAGALPYQTSSGSTTFLSAGSNGQYLTLSSGVPVWTSLPSNVSSFSAGTTGFTPSTSTTGAVTLSGTLNVANGGTGVTTATGTGAGSSVVLSQQPQINSPVITAYSTTTVPLKVYGLSGQITELLDVYTYNGGSCIFQINSSGAISTGTWQGSIISPTYGGTGQSSLSAVSVGSATNLVGGSAGYIPYQSGSGSTSFVSAGTTGQFLQSNGTGAPTWATPVSYATVTDDTTTNGTRYPLFANQTSGSLSTEYTSSTKLQYNPSTGVFTATSFSGAGTGLTGTASSLSIGGNAATATSATSATTSTNLAGGSANQIPYQTGAGATSFITAPSVASTALTWNGSAFTWATSSGGVTISDDTSSATAYYPLFARVTSGTATTEYTSSTNLQYTPSTGSLTALAVNSSGGALNGSIGATTPNTGTFTTITGQTEVLKGTGENLFTQSNNFTNATAWNSSVTFTTGQTDPFGGSTATQVVFSSQFQGFRNTQYTLIAGVTYTASIWCYVASGTRVLSIVDAASNVYGTFTATTSWNRYSVTFTALASSTLFPIQDRNASGFVNTYVYGAQLEIGSVTNTYVPTTTTAVYGTPTLSFSGVAGLGLQSDGSLYVSPAGTGALQAQATTSSTVGGNARGANAVDWQTSRNSAGQVASASYSVVGGGLQNTASGGYSSIVGGYGHTASGQYSFVGGGYSQQATAYMSAIVGGSKQSALGYYNFIGAGYQNSGTSGSFVTQQAAATNGVTSGSTAVTLAASNASIKVGQYITGTGISGETYVAAISGTSLTLSQNANATGTPTLSFYTPHGVVVGGGNNQATGSYSFIGGGGDAGTSSNRNVASGDWSAVVGGNQNTASGQGAFVGGGGTYFSAITAAGNTASGQSSAVLGGATNTASGAASSILGGVSNTANGVASIACGTQSSNRSIAGVFSFGATRQSINGDSQAEMFVLRTQTTDATATVLTTNGSTVGTTNQVILPNNSAYSFRVTIIAGITGAGNTSSWILQGAIKRGATASTTAIVGAVNTTLLAQDSGASTWAVSATADTTNGGLAITVTGQASTTIRWVAKCETTEMTF